MGLLYIVPEIISCRLSPTAAPTAIELTNEHGDSVVLTVRDWRFSGDAVVLAQLTNEAFAGPAETIKHHKVLVPHNDLVAFLATWQTEMQSASNRVDDPDIEAEFGGGVEPS